MEQVQNTTSNTTSKHTGVATLKFPTNTEIAISREALLKRGVPEELIQKLSTLPSTLCTTKWFLSKQNGKAAHVLVDIREAHCPPLSAKKELGEKLYKAFYDVGNKVQQQLEGILKHLGNPTIYKDGIDQKSLNRYRRDFITLAKNKAIVNELEQKCGATSSVQTEALLKKCSNKNYSEETIQGLIALRKHQRLREWIDETAKHHTVIRLFKDQKITILPGEKTEYLEASIKLIENNVHIQIDDPECAKLMNKRDSYHVETVGKAKDKVAFSIWGGGHSLLEEVQHWNKLHPDKLINLVEVTPTEYSQYLED